MHQAQEVTVPSSCVENKPSINKRCTRALVVSPIHVGVAFAAWATLAGKLGSQDMSGGKASRGGIAKNTAPALQLLRSPSLRLNWSNKQVEEICAVLLYEDAKGGPT